MISYPNIDPIVVRIGPLAIHWYALMYLVGFLAGWWLLEWRRKHSYWQFSAEQVSDMVFYSALGVILGGRIGYMLFYDFADWWAHPLQLFAIWQGGMSFHGGLIGVILALWLYAIRINKSLFELTDFVAPVVPIGLGAGRIGNFINGELWGKVSDVPWAMVFPRAGELPRHPSQLYEFFFEGIVLFVILWLFSAKPRPKAAVSGLFLLCYGLFRFSIEFFREPDFQIGPIAFGWMSEGQLLSIPMMLLGMGILMYRKISCSNT